MFVAGFCAAVALTCVGFKHYGLALFNAALSAANIWLALGG